MNQRERMYIEFLKTLKDGRNDAVVESIAGNFRKCIAEGWSPSVSSMAYNQSEPNTWGTRRGHYSGAVDTDTATGVDSGTGKETAHTEREIADPTELSRALNQMLPTIEKVAKSNPELLERFSDAVQKWVTAGYNEKDATADRSDITDKSSDSGKRRGFFNRMRRGFSGLTKGLKGEGDARMSDPAFESDDGHSLNMDNGSLDIDSGINRVKTPEEISVDVKLETLLGMIDTISKEPGLKPSEHERLKEVIIEKINSVL